MATLRAAVVTAIADVRPPSAALARANEAADGFAGGIIATAIVAFLDEREQTLTFAGSAPARAGAKWIRSEARLDEREHLVGSGRLGIADRRAQRR